MRRCAGPRSSGCRTNSSQRIFGRVVHTDFGGAAQQLQTCPADTGTDRPKPKGPRVLTQPGPLLLRALAGREVSRVNRCSPNYCIPNARIRWLSHSDRILTARVEHLASMCVVGIRDGIGSLRTILP
jgi:hypothetical protein